ncbi:hypothetical protein LWI29_024435 [Acer saccharum]|uniref:MCM OB domain-containing protein n=1 Tax=Acer saccharum TaxID=4024 RepID=A0AA39VVR0_ACESA|nr:hypothetical protein LWI29_024435 [Acer saccharum]
MVRTELSPYLRYIGFIPLLEDLDQYNYDIIINCSSLFPRKYSFGPPASKLRFADKQIVSLQETPDDFPEGGTPHTVSLLMHDKLVDAGKPGDRVTGIYRAMSVKLGQHIEL